MLPLSRSQPRGPSPSHQGKIDHFVVLFMENRAFDHLFGCQVSGERSPSSECQHRAAFHWCSMHCCFSDPLRLCHCHVHHLGCQHRPGIDGIPKHGRDIPIDPADPSKGSVHVSCGTAKLVCDPGPSTGSPWQGFWGQHFSPACAKNASHVPYGGAACQVR